ncbi:hypothetical protein [Streptomyces sp. NPDC002209]|uniref:hypothetical protein n=1 Tax=Streptomyces sp. NPDC002209 TaxID=3364638 RepID=UPI0036B3ABEF
MYPNLHLPRTFFPISWCRVVIENPRFDRAFLVLDIRSTPITYGRLYPRVRRGYHWDLPAFYPMSRRQWPTQVAQDLPDPTVLIGCLDEAELIRRVRQRQAHGYPAHSLGFAVGQVLVYVRHLARSSPDREVREHAQRMVAAALAARQAILESETVDGWKPAVADFASTFLGLSRPNAEWLEAMSTALLGNWFSSPGTTTPEAIGTLDELRREAQVVHRQLMPLWERKAGPGRVWALDYLLPSGGSVHEVIDNSYRIEDEVLPWEPERKDALSVFGRLKSDEQHVARAYALGGGTWEEAATEACQPRMTGQRVMRKLRRLGNQRLATSRLGCGAVVTG